MCRDRLVPPTSSKSEAGYTYIRNSSAHDRNSVFLKSLVDGTPLQPAADGRRVCERVEHSFVETAHGDKNTRRGGEILVVCMASGFDLQLR